MPKYSKYHLRYRRRPTRRPRKRPTKKAVVSTVKSVIRNQEPYKYNMTTLNNSIPSNWTILANLSNITFNTENQPDARSGTKVQLKNFALRTKLVQFDSENIVRLALVRGRRAGDLNAADISFDPNATGDDLNCPFNQRFVDVRWDKTYKLQENAPGAVYPPYQHIDINKALNSICKYEQFDTDTTVQPYNNTSWYLVGCSDSTITGHPSVRGQIRVSFKDLE